MGKGLDEVGIREVREPAWQPIETAPKDGTPILIAYAAGGKTWSRVGDVAIRPARWRKTFHPHTGLPSEGWQFEVAGFVVGHKQIAGWMPLPEPPQALENSTASLADATPKNPPSCGEDA